MNYLKIKAFALLTVLLAMPGIITAQNDSRAKRLDSIFNMLYLQNQFNGSVLIVEKGVTLLKKGYGYSDEKTKAINNPETIFELASCSKQFTAAAIVLLKRKGKLDYNDRLDKYISELGFWKDVTIMDLLKHTSGLPEYLADMGEAWDSNKIATNRDMIKFYASRKDTLQFKPGSRHSYTNTNYALLASIIEKVSGETYAGYLKKNIFDPLNMKNTFVYSRRLAQKNIKNYATGYVFAKNSFSKVVPEHPLGRDSSSYSMDGIVGGAKVHSTVSDIYLWLTALKNNTLFTKSEFEQMTAVTKTTAGKDIRYGFGLDLSKGENKFAFGHTGSWDGYMTFIYYDVIRDRVIITLQNSKAGASPTNNIFQILDGRPLITEYRKKINLDEADIKKYAGTYIDENNKDDAQIVTYLDGHLIHNSIKIPWDIRFFAVSQTEFQGIMQGGNDGVLRFTQLENGSIKLEMLQYGQLQGSGIKNK